uniref:LOW QUALITY PROTEIN: fatty acid oxidation complex subunit alpha-like n=1 Tax=Erigeron canadensis TaxID=72917 RepID=UPI001CB97529|nr:LOW QUALITY PROTEIN: fatty acid oxidation complex subunit alpha-like [Erigeron canadensis]
MCTLEKYENLFYLTLTGGGGVDDEHRLNPTVISSIRSALSDAKSQATPGSVLITMAHGKYFCNGYDIKPDLLAQDPVLHTSSIFNDFKPLAADIVSLPMPTIAIVTGHAVGSGLTLAMCHDYVFMTRGRGVLYLPEIQMGISLPSYGVELVKLKVAKPDSLRDILLGGVKVKADQAVAMGIVDMAYDNAESAVEGGVGMGKELEKKKLDGEVYAEIRKSMYPELCRLLGLSSTYVLKGRSLEKRGNLFFLTITGRDDEHRLNSTTISSIRSALSDAKSRSTPGSVLITVTQGKYFSNGLDLTHPADFSSQKSSSNNKVLTLIAMYKLLVSDLISFPMPTIAVVTGHAGLGLAISHDYVLMTRDHRCILYMISEIDMGVTLPDYGVEMIRSKVTDPNSRRDLLLRGVKVKADEAVATGVVNMAYDSPDSAMKGAVCMGEELAKRKFNGSNYALLIRKTSLYPELCSTLGLEYCKNNSVTKPRL